MLGVFLVLCQWPLAAEDEKQATDFIRVHRGEQAVRLQTAVTRYTKDGVVVDLIGAIHIADADYFKQLNKEFTHYESLLFEMVGGERMNGKLPQAKEGDKVTDPVMRVLGDVYALLSKFLKLQEQKEGIDYTAKNFVHADLTLNEFHRLQDEKGESLLGFALQNAKQASKQQGAAPVMDTNKLMMALLTGNANAVKLQIVGTLGQGDDQVDAFAGNSVIIGDRNAKCLQVLDQQTRAGKNKLGIFYGAAHFPDMEERFIKQGYQKVSQRWLTAWNIPVVLDPAVNKGG